MLATLSLSASLPSIPVRLFFFFNDTATTEIYTLSLHDALPICSAAKPARPRRWPPQRTSSPIRELERSEEHTSELQSHSDLVCRLLLEKKNQNALLIYSLGAYAYGGVVFLTGHQLGHAPSWATP